MPLLCRLSDRSLEVNRAHGDHMIGRGRGEQPSKIRSGLRSPDRGVDGDEHGLFSAALGA